MRKRKNKVTIMLIGVIVIVFILINLIKGSFSRYESNADISSEVQIAFWAFKDYYNTQEINLRNIAPSDNPIEYEIGVSNFSEDGKLAETAIKYDLTLETTTYLPLEYEFWKKVDDNNYQKVDVETTIKLDDEGTYMKELKISDKMEFVDGIVEEKTDLYKLKILFPIEYKSRLEFSDLLDYIQITCEATQLLEGE